MLVIAAVPLFDSDAEEPEAVPAVQPTALPVIVVPIAMLVGFVGGLLVANGGSGDSGIDPADEYQEQAMDFALFAETHFADVSAGMAIDTQVWGYTQMYWDRVAEVAAAALWSPDTDVEPLINSILNDAAVMESMAVIYRSWESVIDTPLYGMSDIPVLNDAAGYGEMEWGVYGDDSHHSADVTVLVDSGTYVRPRGDENKVFLSSAGSDTNPAMNRLYVIETMTFIHESGSRITLTPGVYSLGNLADGVYTLAGGEAVGPFVPVGSGSADTVGALALDIDGTFGYIIPSGDGYVLRLGSETSQVSDAGMYARYPGTDGEVTDDRSLVSVLDAWDGLLEEYEAILAATADNIRAAWMLYDTLGESGSQLPVSVWSPDLENLRLTAEQKYAVALLSMLQASELMEGGASSVEESDLRISEESLELTVVGDIIGPTGDVLAEDVVYTPFCYTEDQRIAVGGSAWTQSGFAIVWGDAETWDGEADTEGMSLIPLDPGSVLRPDSITYMGNRVDAMYLEVKEMSMVLSEYEDVYEPTPMPEPDDTDWGMIAMIILGAAAACLALIGIMARSPVFILLAAIVALVAAFGSGFVGDLLSRVL